MDVISVTVAFNDETQGYPITPRKVPLSVLRELTADFAEFIRASDDVDGSRVDVAVVEGSLAFSTGPIYAPVLAHDIESLGRSVDLSELHNKRRVLVQKWQTKVREGQGRRVVISIGAKHKPIVIDARSQFRVEQAEPWVMVERYLHGELVDLGGSKNSNAHVRLPDGQTLVVRTDRDLIRAEKSNLVYRTVHMRIRAELNLDTSELRNPALIEFVDYSPKFDPVAHARLTEEGDRAWGDIKDAAGWVRELRGGDQ